MRIGSLFSGAGGLDLAVERVFGGRTVWHCEVDPAASQVLAYRWPGVPNLGDITAVDWSSVERVDVLCGGFPCQDVSAAGRRAGIQAGTRSGLWATFADAIGALRPRFVVIENVRGLLSADGEEWPSEVNVAHQEYRWRDDALRSMRAVEAALHGVWKGSSRYAGQRRYRLSQQRDRALARFNATRRRLVQRAIGTVVRDLADLGYDAQWTTVSAASVGAPHKRERVFILATAADAAGECGTYVEGRGTASSGQPFLAEPGAGDGDRGGPIAEGVRELRGSAAELATVDLLPTPRRSDGDGGANPLSRAERMDDVETRIIRLLQTPSAADGDGSRKARGGERGNELLLPGQAVEMAHRWGKYEAAIRRWELATRPAPSPTEPNTYGAPRLAPAFSEWMQGWPLGWVTHLLKGEHHRTLRRPVLEYISRNDALRIIGNGVCPQQAAAALWQLIPISELAA